MVGTLKAALDVRQVKLPNDAIAADVIGRHELRDGLPVLAPSADRYKQLQALNNLGFGRLRRGRARRRCS